MGDSVRVEIGDGSAGAPAGVATIRLDRPPMNALNSAVQEDLRAAAAQITADDSVRAVVIYGGEKVFAAGADVKEFSGQDHAQLMRDAPRVQSAIDSLARIPKPVIAAVTGYALGGGCELALTADFRVSADNAKWGQPEILLGIIPGMGGSQRLPRLVGPAKAKDLIFTGRFVEADEALAIGLVDVVVPAAEVYPTALAMAAKFAKGPRLALAAAKAAIDGGLDTDLATGLRLESHLFASLFATEDRTIGLTSFLERGPGKAVFSGVPGE
jgi:enoyl-CoA hydratase/carnithine racemase